MNIPPDWLEAPKESTYSGLWRCAETLSLVDPDRSRSGEIDVDMFRNFAKNLEPTLPTIISTADGRTAKTLAQLFSRWGEKIDTMLKAWRTLQTYSKDHQLGIYTTEQEADDFAAELLATAGYDVKTIARHALLNQLKKKEEKGIYFRLADDVTFDECLILLQRNWANLDPRHAYIPLGNWANPHHDYCYRYFNVEHELKAHDYQTPGVSVPVDIHSPAFRKRWSILLNER